MVPILARMAPNREARSRLIAEATYPLGSIGQAGSTADKLAKNLVIESSGTCR
jgi:hypothetical protein